VKKLIATALIAASLACGAVSSVSADPIVCPPPQVSTHTSDGGWFCTNPAGHDDNAAAPKHE
jgi:hypothetical protein